MADAHLAAIAYHLPERRVTNEDLAAEHPDWDVARIASKTGILARRIAAPDETATDLAMRAAEKLLSALSLERDQIDAVLLCTQSPDYALPTSACLLQAELGLSTDCAALDFNQGCSGYVYGLYLAKALIASGEAKNVLLVTAETYSKYIHPGDRSVRVLFGDGASASLITATPGGARIGTVRVGTDGSGAERLIVPAGGARRPRCAETRIEARDENGSVRTPEHLYMDGPELFTFTLKRVPEIVDRTLTAQGLARGDVQWFVFHQANAFMNNHLRTKLGVPKDRAPLFLEQVGNTVSSTIPIVLREHGARFQPDDRVLLVGFGVGFSWGAAVLDWGKVALV
jgi:3-oxoacyl-[acyl-carrier-protein] synthase III